MQIHLNVSKLQIESLRFYSQMQIHFHSRRTYQKLQIEGNTITVAELTNHKWEFHNFNNGSYKIDQKKWRKEAEVFSPPISSYGTLIGTLWVKHWCPTLPYSQLIILFSNKISEVVVFEDDHFSGSYCAQILISKAQLYI